MIPLTIITIMGPIKLARMEEVMHHVIIADMTCMMSPIIVNINVIAHDQPLPLSAIYDTSRYTNPKMIIMILMIIGSISDAANSVISIELLPF